MLEGAGFISKYLEAVKLCTNTGVQRLLSRCDVNGTCEWCEAKWCIVRPSGLVVKC